MEHTITLEHVTYVVRRQFSTQPATVRDRLCQLVKQKLEAAPAVDGRGRDGL